MQILETFLTIVHVFVSLVLILAVLLQSGKGGGMGAAFGGASAQIFGGQGAGNFLAKITTAAAVIFMTTSLTLSMIGSKHGGLPGAEPTQSSTVDAAEVPEAGSDMAPKADGDINIEAPEDAAGADGVAKPEPSSDEANEVEPTVESGSDLDTETHAAEPANESETQSP